VVFAVYGALRSGNPDGTEASEVTAQLQKALNNTPGEHVSIDNATSGGDAAPGVKKHFAATVVLDGLLHHFACKAGQEIDFS
jgi:hypothetical protein